jgi:hypothetical protein
MNVAKETFMTTSTDDAVLRRLAHLERTVRWWKRVGAGVLAVLGVMILVAASVRMDPKTADEVLARHFILVGRTPSPRASLTLGQDGGPGLLFFDQQGQVRAGLTVLADGRPSLGLLDAQGQSRVILTLESDGTPIMRLLNAQGQVMWSAP